MDQYGGVRMRKCVNILCVCVLIFIQGMVLHAQWVRTSGLSGPTDIYANVRALAVLEDTNIFAGTLLENVFLSTNDGTGWTSFNYGLTYSDIFTLTVSGTNLFAGTWYGGVFILYDDCTTWTAAGTGLVNTGVNALVFSDVYLFAGTGGYGVYRSIDYGASWTAVNSGLTNTNINALAASGTNLFAGTYGAGVFLSSDNGLNWTAVNSGLTCANINALAVSGTNLFAGTYGGGAFLSTDNGTSWTAVNSGLTTADVRAFAVCGTNIFAGSWGDGVFRSTNNGANWTAVNSGLTPNQIYAFAVSKKNLFAGTYHNGVWRRRLSELIVPVELVSFTALLQDENVTLDWITAAETNNAGFVVEHSREHFGPWKTIGFVPGKGSSTEQHSYHYGDPLTEELKSVPAVYYRLRQKDYDGAEHLSNILEVCMGNSQAPKLHEPYPNPASAVTEISFSLPEEMTATLHIYNAFGLEVAKPADGLRKAGMHSVPFNSGGISSGIYMCVLHAGGKVLTKKLMVVR
jgi:hypothetical protein